MAPLDRVKQHPLGKGALYLEAGRTDVMVAMAATEMRYF
jgi:hypothetical protein